MPATQSTKPSDFLPVFRTVISAALETQERFVRLVAQPDPSKWSTLTQDFDAAIYLGPISGPLIRSAGAGRNGTPVEQTLTVILRSRSFADQAGGNEAALMGHYDRELKVVDAIHLQHLTGSDSSTPLFIMPPRLIESGDGVKRVITPDGSIQSTLPFLVTYPLALTVA
jgi:hypothetical protein